MCPSPFVTTAPPAPMVDSSIKSQASIRPRDSCLSKPCDDMGDPFHQVSATKRLQQDLMGGMAHQGRGSSDQRLPIMTSPYFLRLFILLSIVWAVASEEISNSVTCVTSWSGRNGAPRTVELLSPDRINDGYCDCLDTAADETKTDACAGVNNWDGLATTPETRKKTT